MKWQANASRTRTSGARAKQEFYSHPLTAADADTIADGGCARWAGSGQVGIGVRGQVVVGAVVVDE